MPQTGGVDVRVTSKITSAGDLASATANLDRTFSTPLTNGTGLNQANNSWSDRRSLATAANEDLDVSGSLTNALGVAVVFTKIKSITIYALPTNTTSLTISRPAANGVPFLLAAGDGFVLTPGGTFALTNPSDAGIAVTAATGDLINIANAAGATADYDIVIVGVTA